MSVSCHSFLDTYPHVCMGNSSEGRTRLLYLFCRGIGAIVSSILSPYFFSFPTSTCCIFDFVDRYSHALGLFSANTSLVLPRFVVFGFYRYNPFIMHLDFF
jgi:hypothetical protein